MRSRPVVLVAYDGVQGLDVTGPFDVFSGANDALGTTAYEVGLAATVPGRIRTASGMALVADLALDDELDIDTLVVPGGRGVHTARREPLTVTAVARHARSARRVASVCTGTFLLAEAGALDGGPVTTHWAHADRLADEFPDLVVERDPIFVRNGRCWSSAGVTAGIDLSLALVEEDHGAGVAQTIARHLVMFLRRPGGQSQFATAVWSPAADPGPIRAAQDQIHGHPADDLSVEALAARVGLSPRHFQREFVRRVGETPGRYVERVRVEAARRALEDTPDALVAVVARGAGFGSAETLRRSFVRHVGVPPDEYRRRFATTAPAP